MTEYAWDIYIYIKIYVYFFLNGMHSNLDKNQKAPTLVHAYKCLETDRQTDRVPFAAVSGGR